MAKGMISGCEEGSVCCEADWEAQLKCDSISRCAGVAIACVKGY